ncbi:hypothetical protein N4G70_13070 [Streptomyces sp. ASQP_92]|uniref:hypothetical protein n=1 Tax=Streptomyces sp. ASQP_92 TaxID=2979116 RepID=UPI0021BFFDAD|nr:hypothetical protein [Streptomyces sp. ASQP_92]MCT9089793.1 hypothetical protein [Streptomyces sp. ASQP_92]
MAKLVKHKALAVTVTVIVAAVVAAGFAYFPSDDGPTASATANTRRFVLILAGASGASESGRFDLEVAARTEALTAACMKSHGFQYLPKDPRSVVDVEDASDFTSLDYARTHGFGISVFPHFVPEAPETKKYEKSLSAASLKAHDSALAGCVDNSQRTAEKEYGIPEANSVWARVDGEVQRDGRYEAALETWRACAAAAAGHPARSRLALITDLRKQYTSVMAALRTGTTTPSQDQLAALAAKAPAWQKFHRAEIDAAVATFPCSQTADRAYVSTFMEHLNPSG